MELSFQQWRREVNDEGVPDDLAEIVVYFASTSQFVGSHLDETSDRLETIYLRHLHNRLALGHEQVVLVTKGLLALSHRLASRRWERVLEQGAIAGAPLGLGLLVGPTLGLVLGAAFAAVGLWRPPPRALFVALGRVNTATKCISMLCLP